MTKELVPPRPGGQTQYKANEANGYWPNTNHFKVRPVKSGGTAYRRWICLAKLLLEAEQGNWTSLCRVALRKRSQKFSKSSRSSSDVFSNTAITSVVTMLYTTKKEACRKRGNHGVAMPRQLSTSPEIQTTQPPTRGPPPWHSLGSTAPQLWEWRKQHWLHR